MDSSPTVCSPARVPAGSSAGPEWPSVHAHPIKATERSCFTKSTSLRGTCESRGSEGPGRRELSLVSERQWLGGLPGLTPWTAWRRKVGRPGEPCRSKVVGGQQAPVSPQRPSLPVASTGSEESSGSHRNSSTCQSLYSRPLGKAQQKVRTQQMFTVVTCQLLRRWTHCRRSEGRE